MKKWLNFTEEMKRSCEDLAKKWWSIGMPNIESRHPVGGWIPLPRMPTTRITILNRKCQAPNLRLTHAFLGRESFGKNGTSEALKVLILGATYWMLRMRRYIVLQATATHRDISGFSSQRYQHQFGSHWMSLQCIQTLTHTHTLRIFSWQSAIELFSWWCIW